MIFTLAYAVVAVASVCLAAFLAVAIVGFVVASAYTIRRERGRE